MTEAEREGTAPDASDAEADERSSAPEMSPTAEAPRASAASVEGPVFVRSFPADPELDRLVAAFVAGDYGTVRAGAEKLAASTKDDAVRRAAKELRRRLDPDPLAKLLVVGAMVLLAVLAAYYGANPHVP